MRRVQIETSHRFDWMIWKGLKHHTCRRTLRCVPGDTLTFSLSIYDGEGLKTIPFEAVCKDVQGLVFDHQGIVLAGRALPQPETRAIARADGFVDFQEMIDWFYGLYQVRVFHGFLISW